VITHAARAPEARIPQRLARLTGPVYLPVNLPAAYDPPEPAMSCGSDPDCICVAGECYLADTTSVAYNADRRVTTVAHPAGYSVSVTCEGDDTPGHLDLPRPPGPRRRRLRLRRPAPARRRLGRLGG
jgi:hypothetical protein